MPPAAEPQDPRTVGPADAVAPRRDLRASLLSRVYGPLRERFHEARADLFVDLVGPRPGQRMLDLGGGDGSFAARIARRVRLDVTVAEPEPTRLAAERHGFSVMDVRPGEPLPFDDGAFDIVLCNSVIEHATFWKGDDEGTWKERARRAQARFAAEIRRVAPAWFVQAPHADFPIEPHQLLPFTNWLPHGVVERLVPWTDRFWIKKAGVADWLLPRAGWMRELFPDGEVHVERLMGLPKSVVAYRRVRMDEDEPRGDRA